MLHRLFEISGRMLLSCRTCSYPVPPTNMNHILYFHAVRHYERNQNEVVIKLKMMGSGVATVQSS
jgi:hypothetical protein